MMSFALLLPCRWSGGSWENPESFFFFSNENSNFNNISTWKRPRKTEKLTKITETLTLKYSLQPKTKEDVGIGVWDFKREEGNSLGDGKADV